MKKHKIKNIDSLERDLPIYDGSKRIIKFDETLEAEVIGRVKYMINNGFFEDLGEVVDDDKSICKNNIYKEQKEIIEIEKKKAKEKKKAIKEEHKPKRPRKKRAKYKKIKGDQ